MICYASHNQTLEIKMNFDNSIDLNLTELTKMVEVLGAF